MEIIEIRIIVMKGLRSQATVTSYGYKATEGDLTSVNQITWFLAPLLLVPVLSKVKPWTDSTHLNWKQPTSVFSCNRRGHVISWSWWFRLHNAMVSWSFFSVIAQGGTSFFAFDGVKHHFYSIYCIRYYQKFSSRHAAPDTLRYHTMFTLWWRRQPRKQKQ
jgi:hypothetical protein